MAEQQQERTVDGAVEALAHELIRPALSLVRDGVQEMAADGPRPASAARLEIEDLDVIAERHRSIGYLEGREAGYSAASERQRKNAQLELTYVVLATLENVRVQVNAIRGESYGDDARTRQELKARVDRRLAALEAAIVTAGERFSAASEEAR